jgi:hypothetical protein|tara:strand:- start:913 stop:1107 length:195 start_codon:yes stop_codon:yes gene_type:complete
LVVVVLVVRVRLRGRELQVEVHLILHIPLLFCRKAAVVVETILMALPKMVDQVVVETVEDPMVH